MTAEGVRKLKRFLPGLEAVTSIQGAALPLAQPAPASANKPAQGEEIAQVRMGVAAVSRCHPERLAELERALELLAEPPGCELACVQV